MRGPLLAVCAALSLGAIACGAPTRPAVRLLADRFTDPRVALARETAPDVLAAAERARSAAESARARGDADAADDHTTCARLYLEAALLEARRADETRARTAAERVTQAADDAALRDEQARLALEVETRRRDAARVAELEFTRALARAQASEPRRGARLPSGDVQDASLAARALARRARLLLAAATALGATAAETSPVELQLAAYDAALASRTRTAEAQISDALAAADAARRAAEAVLGAARARLGAPGPEAIAALAETARLAGLDAQLSERGMLVYANAFHGSATVPDARAIGALTTVLRTHATGPVFVEHEGAHDAAGARLVPMREARLVRALIAAGIAASRLSASTTEPASAPEGNDARAVLVMSAYGGIPH